MTNGMPKKDSDPTVSLGSQTEYQLHKSFVPALNADDNVIDYTERRLCKILERVKDQKIRVNLQTLLEDYRNGRAVIAWRSGVPCYLPVKQSK